MTTYIDRPPPPTLSMRAVVGGTLARVANNVQQGSVANRARTRVQSLIRFVWHLAGFAALTIGMFSWTIMAGWITVGISCFAMSTLTTKTPASPDDEESSGNG